MFCFRVNPHCIALINHVILSDVSPADAVRIDEERERRRRKFRFRRYYPDRQLLILALNTPLHEQFHIDFYFLLIDKLNGLGLSLREDWRSMGKATYPTYPLEPTGRLSYGEGDSTGGPLSSRSGPGKWPTLVLEGGHSQSLEQLRADLGWWFSASNHDVKIVQLLKFDRARESIIVEKWVEEEIPERPSASTTGPMTAQQLQPVCRQNVIIRRDKTTDPVSYPVTGAPLILRVQAAV
jgi:hypothetical protein